MYSVLRRNITSRNERVVIFIIFFIDGGSNWWLLMAMDQLNDSNEIFSEVQSIKNKHIKVLVKSELPKMYTFNET